jgi:hypothetical protein
MGNTSNYILVVLAINLMMGMIALGIQSIDPDSELLLGNKLFGRSTTDTDDNLVVRAVNNASGVASYDWNRTQFDSMGSSSSSIVSTVSSAFPDWIRSGFTWLMDAGRTYVNIVGAPFTIVSALGMDAVLSALIGSFFGIFATFIMLNWLLGRDT